MNKKYLPIISDHFATFYTTRNRKKYVLWKQVILSFGVPCAAGIILWASGIRLNNLGNLLSGVAVLTALLFALVIYVFQLRTELSKKTTDQANKLRVELIDQLFANVTYSTALSLTFTIIIVIMDGANLASETGHQPPLEPWATGLIAAMGAHLVASVFQSLSRTRSAYHAVKR